MVSLVDRSVNEVRNLQDEVIGQVGDTYTYNLLIFPLDAVSKALWFSCTIARKPY